MKQPKRNYLLLALALWVSQAPATPAPGPAASIVGSVTDTNGNVIPNARVTYQPARQPEAGDRFGAAPPAGLRNGEVEADAIGAFRIENLRPATYLLCAAADESKYLPSCDWGNATRVNLSQASTATQNLTLKEGVRIIISINDPNHLLPQTPQGLWTPPKLTVGAMLGTAAYHGAGEPVTDATGRSYEMLVPPNSDLTLWIYSSDVTLADAHGMPLRQPADGVGLRTRLGDDLHFAFTATGISGSAPNAH